MKTTELVMAVLEHFGGKTEATEQKQDGKPLSLEEEIKLTVAAVIADAKAKNKNAPNL